jgi:hypothetical protein
LLVLREAGVTDIGFLYLLDAASLIRARLRSGWLRALRLRAESVAARPQWTDGDREWLESNRASLPGGRRWRR